MTCSALLGGYAPPEGGTQDLKTQVQSLLVAMATGSEGQRATAEWALLKLGPSALAHLPRPDASKERLAALIATLEAMRPRTCTMSRTEIALDEALKLLRDQTQLTLRDLRQDKS